MFNYFYYGIKPIIPRAVQLIIRRQTVLRKKGHCSGIWPIDESSCKVPDGFKGWPGNKRFALVLTHDVETACGQDKCYDLIKIEEELGFKSSFGFVPNRYSVSGELRKYLADHGFEIVVHGLYHDGKLYRNKKLFDKRAAEINKIIKAWNAVGFRSPSMHKNLDWIHEIDIKYDSSTFDTDPFEPQYTGLKSIYPLWIPKKGSDNGYVELPYTLAQDFTLFVLMKEATIDIWKRKLDWIAGRGGMALVITHPDYMNFKGNMPAREEYPKEYYVEFLEYIKENYKDQYWHVLPRDMADFWLNGHISRKEKA